MPSEEYSKWGLKAKIFVVDWMLCGFNEIPYKDFKIVRDVIEMIFSTKVGPRFRIWRYRYNASCRVGYTLSSPNCCYFSTLMITWRLSIVLVPCSTVAWGVKQSIIDLIDRGRGVWCDGQLVGGVGEGRGQVQHYADERAMRRSEIKFREQATLRKRR